MPVFGASRVSILHVAHKTYVLTLRFILKFLWHLDLQKRKALASFLTKVIPFDG